MRSAARQIARLVPSPRSVRPRLLDLSECPHCRSRLVQAADWKVLESGKVSLALRCPECESWMYGTFSADRVRELERSVAEGSEALRSLYAHTARENMKTALTSFAKALELDLIGPGDFERSVPARAPRGSWAAWRAQSRL